MKTTTSLFFKGSLFCLMISFSMNAQVGIGTVTPSSALDIDHSTSTGNTLEANHNNTSNGSSAIWVRNSGVGRAINAQSLNASNNLPAVQISQVGTGAAARGLEIGMDATTTAIGLSVFQDGSGSGGYIGISDATNSNPNLQTYHNGTGNCIVNNANGSGWGIYNLISGSGGGTINEITGTGLIANISDLSTSAGGGVGYYSFFNGATGNGFIVDNIGGDGFAFSGDVVTSTATVGNTVYGSVLSGEQSGLGHGVLVNHSGTSGRNAEFNINNTANTDNAITAIHKGQGSAIVGQNQNNTITGIVTVADFSYTGSDVSDHVGVSGSSTPALGWGIGVIGIGNFYGVYSNGELGASGTKTFVIDHPDDPENKMLKHFSMESNEVLNVYRGTETFDNTGKVKVMLPDYYHSINKNASYQLTPIGASMPNLYIEREIENGIFIIAGGIANKKVSWVVTAERNDPYLKQNPEKRNVIVEKIGDRRGKYLTPELYNQPEEKSMHYRETKEVKSNKMKEQKFDFKKNHPEKTTISQTPEETEEN